MSHLLLRQLATMCSNAAVGDLLNRYRREHKDASLEVLQSRAQLLRIRVGLRQKELESLSTNDPTYLALQQSIDNSRAELQIVMEIIGTSLAKDLMH